MEGFCFIYILRSLRDGKNYAGYTKNLELRFEQHFSGEVDYTELRRPLAQWYKESNSSNLISQG
jgi:putative endonuclease